MSELEALKAVAALSLLTDDNEHLVRELSSFDVVSLGPTVSGSRMSEDEIVRAENASVGSKSDRVHGSGLKIDENGTEHVLSAWKEINIVGLR